MFRSITPIRRTYSIFALATFGVAAIFGMTPALALQVPAVAVASDVTGRNGLLVTVTGVAGAVSVTLTDASEADAVWTFEDAGTSPEEPRVLHLDLTSPAIGVEPVNGIAAVAVAAGETELHRAGVVLDRDPVAPAIDAVVTGADVELSWSAVSGPGAVTYRLERAHAAGSWSTVRDESSATSVSDRAVTAGSYSYRLTAAVPGSDGQPNQSEADEVSVTVEDLAPVPPGDPEPEAPGDPPDGQPRDPGVASDGDTPQPSDAETAPGVQRRRVAAAGADVRRIAPRAPVRPVVRGYAKGPGLAGLGTMTAVRYRFVTPRVASAMVREITQPRPAARPRIAASLPPPAPSAPLTVATVEPVGGAARAALGTVVMMLFLAHAVVWRSRVNPAGADRP